MINALNWQIINFWIIQLKFIIHAVRILKLNARSEINSD